MPISSYKSGEHDLSYTQNRELSWLSFNARVLEEAADPTVPLIERLRYISIFTSNLDEFFMVRVGSLFDLSVVFPNVPENKSGKTPSQQLDMIFEAVAPLINYRDVLYSSLLPLLSQSGIKDYAYEELSSEDRQYVQDYYSRHIKPLLSPQIIDRSHPFPHLKNKALYVAAIVASTGKERLAIVGVPDPVPPIIRLPGQLCGFVRTETVLAANMAKLFKSFTISEQSVISVTRNADISYDDDKFGEADPDFRVHMSKLLKKRDRLAPVRLEMQSEAPSLRTMLLKKLNLQAKQAYTCKCPLTLGWAYSLDQCGAHLYNTPYTPVFPSELSTELPMWEQVQARDVLLFYPYHSISPFLTLLKESASDPRVQSIKITIYRLAKNSAVVKHLCDAAANGKQVTVMMELRARFDERGNIEWAESLEQAGCNIIYGPENFKCHSKICLITRSEKNGFSHIVQVGTGNYNEKTAELYTDFSLMTANPELAEDAISFFQNMMVDNLYGVYTKLLVAPVDMKDNIMNLIDREIAKGVDGYISIKVNSVTERQLIDKLCEASCAGVQIKLIIRGICCLVPGIPEKTENITVISIVGRFLEHSRVYCFGKGEDREVFISSADIMTRNQTRRVEIACPILDSGIADWMCEYFDTLLSDNVKARRLLQNGSYVPIGGTKPPFNSQDHYFSNVPVFARNLPGAKQSITGKAKSFLDRFKK